MGKKFKDKNADLIMLVISKYLKLSIILLFVTSCKNFGFQSKNLISCWRINAPAKTIDNFKNGTTWSHGAIIRGDSATKKIALVFTGDEFGDGGELILKTLKKQKINASFFLTGNFYRNKKFTGIIKELKRNANYLGSHSDKHLLYCDWEKRDSLLINKIEFLKDLNDSYLEMSKFGISQKKSRYFLPPYEWYNDSISLWTAQSGLQLVNFTPGTRSNADYTYPEMEKNYVTNKIIFESVMNFEKQSSKGLNGFILLFHIGTDRKRTDKFYYQLPQLIKTLKDRGYRFVRIEDLLKAD